MKVSWDYEIPNIWKVIKFMFQTTNQLYTGTNYCTSEIPAVTSIFCSHSVVTSRREDG